MASRAGTEISAKSPTPRAAEPRHTRRADQRPILDRLPIGVLVYRLDKLIYANRAFLDWTGYGQLQALEQAGGLDALFVEPATNELGANNGAQSLTIATNQGDQVPVEARLFTSPWEGESALVLMLTGVGTGRRRGPAEERRDGAPPRQGGARAKVATLLDAAADGVVVLDSERVGWNRSIAAPRSCSAMSATRSTGLPFASLFAPESQREVTTALGSAASPARRRRAATSSAGAATAISCRCS